MTATQIVSRCSKMDIFEYIPEIGKYLLIYYSFISKSAARESYTL